MGRVTEIHLRACSTKTCLESNRWDHTKARQVNAQGEAQHRLSNLCWANASDFMMKVLWTRSIANYVLLTFYLFSSVDRWNESERFTSEGRPSTENINNSARRRKPFANLAAFFASSHNDLHLRKRNFCLRNASRRIFMFSCEIFHCQRIQQLFRLQLATVVNKALEFYDPKLGA